MFTSKDFSCFLTSFNMSNPLKFSNELNKKKKIRKEHENIFCGLSQLLKNISWSINTCLKYFMTSATALQPHFIYLMYSHFLMKSIMFVSKFPEILDDEFKITLLSILINFKNHITKTSTQIFSCEYQRFLRTTILKIS